MNSKEMWKQFCIEKNVDPAVFHEAWQFGGAPDKLARLVLEGKKTATASGYDLYTLDANEKVPQSGDYSVILDGRNEAVCVIRTCKTYVCPFLEVSKEHAKKEGEGDLSLSWWRKVHEEFFMQEYENCGLVFDENHCQVLCEEFELLYQDPLALK